VGFQICTLPALATSHYGGDGVSRRSSSRLGFNVPARPLAEIGAEFLFEVIAERAERATLIVTTNLPFSEWTQVFQNPRLCKALLDRIRDRAHINTQQAAPSLCY
jgi:hypothetical protein